MKCEKCNKRKAKSFINQKAVCHECFCEIKGIKTKFKDHKCAVCGKIFKSMQNPSIPFCSRLCRDKFNNQLKCTEDALNQNYEALCKGDGLW